MKKITSLALAGMLLVPVAHAQTEAVPSATVQAESVPVEVNNKICPVSHEKVGTEGMEPHKVTYNGKVYNLCCSMCAKDFDKDPEKYSKMMDEEAANSSL